MKMSTSLAQLLASVKRCHDIRLMTRHVVDLWLVVVVWCTRGPLCQGTVVLKEKHFGVEYPTGRPLSRDLGRCSFQAQEPDRMFESWALRCCLGCSFIVNLFSASSHVGFAMLVTLTIIRVTVASGRLWRVRTLRRGMAHLVSARRASAACSPGARGGNATIVLVHVFCLAWALQMPPLS